MLKIVNIDKGEENTRLIKYYTIKENYDEILPNNVLASKVLRRALFHVYISQEPLTSPLDKSNVSV